MDKPNVLDLMRKEYPAFEYPEAIENDEWEIARPAPDCIVENYAYADVAVMVAPGGTGKTTLVLYESIHIVLGLDLWGNRVIKPGNVLIITAEDTREMLIARLRDICREMALTPDQIDLVRDGVRIADVSGASCKLTAVLDDVVRPNHVVEEIIRASLGSPPVLIVIDPAVSFGVGESRTNDAEQGLVEAGRKLRSALNCCVRYIHHSGKQNARDKATDQYAGRGGSAFADGARMVSALANYSGINNEETAQWQKITGYTLNRSENGIVLALPKMSYAPPQPSIYIVRQGYSFTRIQPASKDAGDELAAMANQVWQLLTEELKNGRYHTRNTLESLSKTAGLKRQEIRDSIRFLTAASRIEERDKPASGKGGAHRYLHPVASPDQLGEPIVSGAL